MTDRQLIELGAQELAARHGFADWREMRQRDLEYCCERIEERSGILISLSTIKRIMNGQYNRLPQAATLNAISVYLGYADWPAFKAAKSAKVKGADTEVLRESPEVLPVSRPGRVSRLVIAVGVFVCLVVILLSWDFFTASSLKTKSAASFSIRMTTQNAIPNTVVFTYDIDKVAGDSFFIQQSWDRNRRVRIGRNTHTLTDIYYEPGYHVAKLYANDRIVKTIDVSIPTDNWFFYSKESLLLGQPAYIRTDAPIHNGILGLDRQTLLANKIDPEKPQVYLYTFFPTKIGADADNFRLTARIRTTELRNTACPWIMPEVYCQRGFMYCTVTMPGCTGGISAEFGDQYLGGKTNDLSFLGVNVHQWHRLDIVNRNRQVTVSIDGKPVMTKEYGGSAGLITGLGFHSNGMAEVDSIRLDDVNGFVVYP
jgi:hypothetical protein